MNRIKILIIILLFLVFSYNVKAIVKPTNEFYINDYANILSEETKKYIIEKSSALNSLDGTQIVVTTVNNLEGMSIEDYSLKYARSAGIGDKDKNNGVLILIAYEERELRIEIGYGLEGIINDSKAGRIRDNYMIPYLKNNNWDEGIKNGYDAIYSEIVEKNNLNLEYDKPINNENTIDEDYFFIYSFIGSIIGLILGLFFRLSIPSKKNKLKVLVAFLYFISCFILYTIFLQFKLTELACLIAPFNPIVFILVFSFNLNGSGYSGSGYSGRFNGGGFSSRGGSIGGGGSFGGGGASGKF